MTSIARCLSAVFTALLTLFMNGVHASSSVPEYTLVTDYWPPFRIAGQQETMTGIDIDLVARIEARLGIKIQIQRVPWIRALAMMREGKADFMSGLARTAEREAFIHYTEPPYAQIRPVFYKLASSPKEISRYEDLAGHRIGFTRGSAYFEPFDTDATLDKHSSTDETQLLKMLVGQRFDFIIGSDLQADYEISIRGYKNRIVKADYRPEKSVPLYIGVSRKSAFLPRVEELNRAITELLANGTVTDLLGRYGAAPSAPTTPSAKPESKPQSKPDSPSRNAAPQGSKPPAKE